ncbi:hypothetical protein ACFO0S_02300 [Chryseomicrobium palamuruense]|uniref:Uncharacterized protein n=1 Tax=Chryseomicrobium palamuruense TaxID=682973 RepID=A0ABV8URI0_9BACL
MMLLLGIAFFIVVYISLSTIERLLREMKTQNQQIIDLLERAERKNPDLDAN